jgi:hypothetical protein
MESMTRYATMRMTIGEVMRACAVPAAEVAAYRALRDAGRRANDAAMRDAETMCEAIAAWATSEGRQASVKEIFNELEMKLNEFERTLEAGWRGEPFDAEVVKKADDRLADTFHSVEGLKARSSSRQSVIDDICFNIIDRLSPEENWTSVVQPRLLARAYEVLLDRREVNDEEVEQMVEARFRKWVDEWRKHVDKVRGDTGRVLTTADFKTYLRSFLQVKLPAFANGIYKVSFKRRLQKETEAEALFNRDMQLNQGASTSTTSAKATAASKDDANLREAIAALRCAESALDARALLTTEWVRNALEDAPKFTLPKRGNSSSELMDVGAQMMKDWQREESVLVRWSTCPNRVGVDASKSKAQAGWENLDDSSWREERPSTGPFRVHFMRACGVVEAALRECKTCDYHNVSDGDKHEACAKGAARIMLVASRTMRSGDGLEFCHELFGAPPEFSVIAVDPGSTKALLASASAPAPIVVEISPERVEIKCLDIFKIFKHYFADEPGEDSAHDHGEIKPWAALALVTTQTLRVADDGALKLIKQRITVDKSIPQPELDKFFPLTTS